MVKSYSRKTVLYLYNMRQLYTPVSRPFKGTLNTEPGIYRLISLTSTPCKMLEHIVLHYLKEKLTDLLHGRQHGFRKGLSCKTQLCATFNDIVKAADASIATHAVDHDLKAFNKV